MHHLPHCVHVGDDYHYGYANICASFVHEHANDCAGLKKMTVKIVTSTKEFENHEQK